MYQSGEVDHLVATDAIGMGLNMDLTHVAFAQLHKFDGSDTRRLSAAGDRPDRRPRRAAHGGRHVRHDQWGGGPRRADRRGGRSAPVRADQARSLAQQRPRLRQPRGPRRQPRRRPAGVRAWSRSGTRWTIGASAILSRREDIRARAQGSAGVRLLWQVCQIPDFRKTLTDAHLHMLVTVFKHLTDEAAVLPPAWVGSMIARLDRTDGDIDALVEPDRPCPHLDLPVASAPVVRRPAALAGHRPGGRGPPVGRAARAADAEVRRPADGGTAQVAARAGRARGRDRARRRGRGRRPFGRHARRLRLHPRCQRPRGRASPVRRCGTASRDPPAQSPGGRSGPRAGRGLHDGRARDPLARRVSSGLLQSGSALLRPKVTVTGTDELTVKARIAIERRLSDWLQRLADGAGRSAAGARCRLAARAASSPAARGIAYRLIEGLGSLAAAEAPTLLTSQLAGARTGRIWPGSVFASAFITSSFRPCSSRRRRRRWRCSWPWRRARPPGSPRPAGWRCAETEWPAEPAALAALGYCRLGRQDGAARRHRRARGGPAAPARARGRRIVRLAGRARVERRARPRRVPRAAAQPRLSRRAPAGQWRRCCRQPTLSASAGPSRGAPAECRASQGARPARPEQLALRRAGPAQGGRCLMRRP